MIITAMTPGSIVSVKLMSGEEVVGSFVKQDDKGVHFVSHCLLL